MQPVIFCIIQQLLCCLCKMLIKCCADMPDLWPTVFLSTHLLSIIYCISNPPGLLTWLCISRWGLSLVTQLLSSGAHCASSRCAFKSLRGLKRPWSTCSSRKSVKQLLFLGFKCKVRKVGDSTSVVYYSGFFLFFPLSPLCINLKYSEIL